MTPEELQRVAAQLDEAGRSIGATMQELDLAELYDALMLKTDSQDYEVYNLVSEKLAYKQREDETHIGLTLNRLTHRAMNTANALLVVSSALDRLATQRLDLEAGVEA